MKTIADLKQERERLDKAISILVRAQFEPLVAKDQPLALEPSANAAT